MKTKIARSSTGTVPWWQDLFIARYLREMLGTIPAKRTLAEARFIIKALDLERGDSLLDICCGFGRHLIPLAKRGIKTTGVDICPEYLQEAEQKAKKARVKLNLICEDARKIRLNGKFSGVINMATSIGYFERETDNFKMIKNAYEATKPGGGFLLETMNRDWLARYHSGKDWVEAGDYKILKEREFDFYTGRINSTLTFIRKGEQVQKEISLRHYCFHELRGYFRKAGFEEVTAYGGIDFSPLTFDSRMLFIVGKKPR